MARSSFDLAWPIADDRGERGFSQGTRVSHFEIDDKGSIGSASAPQGAANSLQGWTLDGFATVALILFLAATLLLPIALSVPR